MSTGIDLLFDGRVAHVVLAKPARRNAIDTAMLAQLEDVLHELGRRRDIEIAVLRAEGTVFCAGTDLKELSALGAGDTLHWQRRTGEIVERWSRLELTTVTSFNGPAIGAGAVLGLASDIRIAADTVQVSFPEVAFGIALTWSGIPLLAPLIGADRLKRALLLRETIGIEELARHGLFAAVVAAADLPATLDRTVETLLGMPRLARLMAKRATAAAVAAPGFVTNGYEPFLASLGIAARAPAAFEFGERKKE
jgi:enoyl-CoA hydratase/carnithine racemase